MPAGKILLNLTFKPVLNKVLNKASPYLVKSTTIKEPNSVYEIGILNNARLKNRLKNRVFSAKINPSRKEQREVSILIENI